MELSSDFQRLIARDQLEELLARFDDAVLRNDVPAFEATWTTDAVWEISEPVPMQAIGRPAIVDALRKFHAVNEFFFRTTARPVITVTGDRATLRSPTIELARRAGSAGYANVAMYFDQARHDEEGWRFTRRFYQYLWVDLDSRLAGQIVALSQREQAGLMP